MLTSLFTSRFGGLARRLLRAPIYLYRWRLGWLFGRRFLMLTHRGRRTGQRRQTVLEVIHHDRATRESVVLAGWGRGSDWFRNIQASPALEVETGGHRFVPSRRILSPEEAEAVYGAFEHRHPLEARVAARLLGLPARAAPAERRARLAAYPLVAFRPATVSGAGGGNDGHAAT